MAQVAAPSCDTCTAVLSRPFVCLSCAFAGCWANGHVTNHLHESGHPFCTSLFSMSILSQCLYRPRSPLFHTPNPGVDTKTGSIFCAGCDDFIFDATIDAVHLLTVLSVEEQMTRFQGTPILDARGSVISFHLAVGTSGEKVKRTLSALDAGRE